MAMRSEEQWDGQEVVQRIHRLVMEQDQQPADAVDAVLKAIIAAGQAENVLQDCGHRMLLAYYGEHRRGKHGQQKTDPDNHNPSRFEVEERSFLDLPKPIGNTGEWKPYREWTREDVEEHTDWLKSFRDRIAYKASRWKKVLDWMDEGETIEDIQGEISDEIQEFLEKEAGHGVL